MVWRALGTLLEQSGIMQCPRDGSQLMMMMTPLRKYETWMVDRLLKFKEVFGPRLAELVD